MKKVLIFSASARLGGNSDYTDKIMKTALHRASTAFILRSQSTAPLQKARFFFNQPFHYLLHQCRKRIIRKIFRQNECPV